MFKQMWLQLVSQPKHIKTCYNIRQQIIQNKNIQALKNYIFLQYFPKTYYVSKILFHRIGRYETSIHSSQVFILILACLNPVQEVCWFFQICSENERTVCYTLDLYPFSLTPKE